MKNTSEVHPVRRVLNIVRRAESILAQIFLIAIVLLVFVASVFRTIGYPIVWSVDLAQLLFVWACFFGADIGLQQDRHIGVDILTRALPQKINWIITFAIYLLILGFLIITIIYGTQLAFKNTHRMIESLSISYSWTTMSAPVGGIFLGITVIEKMVAILTAAGVFFKKTL